VDALAIARLIAVGRAAIGIGAIAQPERALGPWIGPDAARPSAAVLARALGARDLVLGAGVLRSMSDPDALRPWLAAGIVADSADLAATLTTPALPWRGRAFVGALAAGAAALGAIALASLDVEP